MTAPTPKKSFNEIIADYVSLGAESEPGSTASANGHAKAAPLDVAQRAAGTRTAEPVLKLLSSLIPKPVHWVWPDRIPAGKLTLLVGDPGLGKSMATLDAAARVSTGAAWPDGSGAPAVGHVLLISAEDDAADTILPRFLAAGGDPRNATMLTAVVVIAGAGDQETRRDTSLSLDAHLDAVEQAITQTGAVLVVIDPLSAYLGRADSHTDAEIRGVLMPLAALAERTGAAFVGVLHLNKRAAGPALYRPNGSIAFIAAARAAHVITPDPDDLTGLKRLFLPLKQNLSVPAAGLAYIVEAADVHADDGTAIATARVVWQKGTVATTASQALGAGEQDSAELSAIDAAKEFLQELLKPGPVASKEVFASAGREGISQRTLKRAKAALAVKATKDGFEGAWAWSLPSDQPTQEGQPAEEGQDSDVGTVGPLGPLRLRARLLMGESTTRARCSHYEHARRARGASRGWRHPDRRRRPPERRRATRRPR